MSIELIAWASRQKTGSPTRKFVLLTLANITNHKTGRCDPAIDYICEQTELSNTAVRTALVALVEMGLLRRERKRRRDGSLGTYVYSFPPGAGDAPLATGDDAGLATGDDALNQEVLNQESSTTANAVVSRAPATLYDPLKGTKIDGRNLPWDALVEVTNADERTESGVIARSLKTIRAVVVDDHSEQAFDASLRGERLIATQIRARARLYRQRWPNVELTPSALAKNWSRVAAPPPEGDLDATLEAAQRGIDLARRERHERSASHHDPAGGLPTG